MVTDKWLSWSAFYWRVPGSSPAVYNPFLFPHVAIAVLPLEAEISIVWGPKKPATGLSKERKSKI